MLLKANQIEIDYNEEYKNYLQLKINYQLIYLIKIIIIPNQLTQMRITLNKIKEDQIIFLF